MDEASQDAGSWVLVAHSDQIRRGQAEPAVAFDRNLVVWRDADGAAHVQDATCPHRDVNLGYAGTVRGCEIECYFHGWRFDGDGRRTDYPGDHRSRLRVHPVVERDGRLLAWVPRDVDVPVSAPTRS
jgi:phenylpropionate dioxygenase-like ring-hydroxylating dioxygenase large terminal subunit